jgi:hypothetical protein
MARPWSSSRRTWIASLLLVALAVTCSVWAWNAFLRPIPPADGRWQEFLGWVDIGVPMPSARIARVRLNVIPVRNSLNLIHGRDRSELWAPSQLRGLVRIAEPRHALNFVRFVDRLKGRGEVRVSASPGYPTLRQLPPADGKDGRTYYTMGELRPADFRAGRFTEARVAAKDGAFEVDRWVYTPKLFQPGNVQHLREAALRDGGYSAKVLSERPAPKIPGVRWRQAYLAL